SAHLKSNQGTIYLLPTGILFAFRKPILFLRAEAMEAVGIHSVLSRTFDFEVVMRNDADVVTLEDLEGIPAENKEGKRAIGFGMVDTKEFARMEEWIKKAGIRDRSLSEDLKAKDKAPTTTSKKRERTADGSGDENESEAEDADEEDLGDEDSDEDEDEDEDDEEEDDEEEEEEEEEEEGKGEDAGSQGEDEEVDELMDD
ncbi:histone chaperone Rttp106-like-domain-containing protein, partial [Dissophora ornata]